MLKMNLPCHHVQPTQARIVGLMSLNESELELQIPMGTLTGCTYAV